MHWWISQVSCWRIIIEHWTNKQTEEIIVRDFKTLSSTLRLDMDFIKENVLSVIMDYKKEAREFDEEDMTLLIVRDCLHNYESYPFQQILNTALHY